MKFLNVPIAVEARKGVPRRIRWGRRTYTVRRLLDFWILQSRWWAREEKRVYFRLETDRGVMEVYRADAGASRGAASPPSEHASKRSFAHPPFIEGDTHTREVRQTESPYRPDAAALAGRRRSEQDSTKSRPHTKGPSAQELQASGHLPHHDVDSSFDSSREPLHRWMLSKVID